MAVIRDVMPVFELYQPASVDDAIALLEKHGADAWVLAGGLDSMDWLKDRLKKPRVVVDLSNIAALRGIKERFPLDLLQPNDARTSRLDFPSRTGR